MPILELALDVHAPIERIFDLSRSINAHIQSTARTREIAIAGVTKGLMNAGDEVTWEATHFGVRQHFTSKITAYDRPRHFQDSMQRGAFAHFIHDHFFEESAGITRMRDRLDFASPLWILGSIADALVMRRYLERFLRERNELLKTLAESDGWKEVLS